MRLEIFEITADVGPMVISNCPDVNLVKETVYSLRWDDITFVTLKKDEDNLLEGSGSLNPEDGLSARYVEGGQEHISSRAPESLDIIVSLLISYLLGNEQWKKMIAWD